MQLRSSSSAGMGSSFMSHQRSVWNYAARVEHAYHLGRGVQLDSTASGLALYPVGYARCGLTHHHVKRPGKRGLSHVAPEPCAVLPRELYELQVHVARVSLQPVQLGRVCLLVKLGQELVGQRLQVPFVEVVAVVEVPVESRAPHGGQLADLADRYVLERLGVQQRLQRIAQHGAGPNGSYVHSGPPLLSRLLGACRGTFAFDTFRGQRARG